MIMDSMKRQSQPKVYLEWYFNTEDLRSILNQNLPNDCEKWLGFLSNDELKNCVEVANLSLRQYVTDMSEEKTAENWDLFYGELFDTIKDKVVEKQAYLVKNFNLVIEDEEIKSEVEDYLKRNKWLM